MPELSTLPAPRIVRPTPAHVIAALVSAVEALPDGRPEFPDTTDVSEDVEQLRRSIEQLAWRLSRRQEQDIAMSRLSQQVMHGLYLDDVLTHVYDGFRSLIPYDRIGCALLEDEGRMVRARWARSESTDLKLRRGFHARMAGSSLAAIIQTERPRILNDLREYLREHPHSAGTARIVAEGMQSSLTCPLIVLGKPIGFLFFSSRTIDCYRGAHTDIFERLASVISAVIERSVHFEQLAYSNAELLTTRDALHFEATHDSLTGTLNRRAILSCLADTTQKGDSEPPFAILLLDVDHFKSVNDEYGHPAGDAVLRVIAKRVSAVLRQGDLIGRYGGEEFLLILHRSSLAEACVAAERVLKVIRSTPIAFESMRRHVTASIGIASYVATTKEPDSSLIRRADQALYRAKVSGRDLASVATPYEPA